jgi:hypothetical protein
MDLRFGVTKFFKKRFGTEEKIDEFCATICDAAKDKIYSTKIDRIDFFPVMLPNELLQEGLGEEFTKIELKYRLAALARQIDFEAYQKSDLNGKKILLMECLIGALREISKKIGFDIDAFEDDLKLALGNL